MRIRFSWSHNICIARRWFCALLVFFGADFIATTIMHLDMSVYALRVLAPCILIVAFSEF